jgi:hypothetical protein
MPEERYHLDRYHAHKKWLKIHRFITAFSLLSVVGVLWAWATGALWYQHYKKAQEHKTQVDGPID